MKTGGLGIAAKMISEARSKNLKIMLGCMTETSCAISAAAQLAPLIDWVDLDGNLLISNDPFTGVRTEIDNIQLQTHNGLGLALRPKFRELFTISNNK